MMRGANTKCILQKPTNTRTASAGSSNTWEGVRQFRGALRELSVDERSQFGREVVEARYVLSAGYKDIGAGNIAEVKEKNRIVILNAGNELSPQALDITGVRMIRRGRGKIQSVMMYLKDVK